MMRKLLWPVATLVAVTAVSGSLTATAPAHAAGTRPAPIAWGACPEPPPGTTVNPRQQCGTLKVPLDHRDPGGRQITIAVSRIPATDPARRRGVLLLNPGGPGSEGLNMPSEAAALSDSLAARYDLVGLDPRGVGHSSPVTCGLNAAEVSPPYPYPAADGSISRNVAFARSAARRCAEASGDVLPFITTAGTARDLDLVRQALGESRISYFGLSYGTYLGTVYASLFPQHTDRMVLDSALDPAKVWYGVYRQQSQGRQERFGDAARYAARHPDEAGLGTTATAVTAAYLRLAARLDTDPAPVPGTSVSLTGPLFRHLTAALLTSERFMPTLAQVWRAAADLADGQATDEQAQVLGQALTLIDPAAGVSPGVPADNAVAAAYAVTCGDVEWPASVGVYERNVAADRRFHPVAAGAPANIWPCAFWPGRPVEPTVKVSGQGPRTILILQNERDPNTTLESARGLHRALGRRSVMVTVDAGGHGVYGTAGAGACATALADAYLIEGELPGSDTRCP
ncbi:alpha/beta fold hydrolase [Kineosporia sp. J2-2]|uniref:Alpha/beta fold hydrolase n=1 Tax=Kineosporia corallincola TaxID=2835133 RepID=A0ABS5TQ60_9ACTN|nr:alpha/beta hydrolase [Kineosporia corallincola]MBT0773250.1 alpha/beta fold hydrolase [Kineosporia corallincola]